MLIFSIPTVTYMTCKNSNTYCGDTRCKFPQPIHRTDR